MFEDKFSTTLSEHGHLEYSRQQTGGELTQVMMGFEQVYKFWKEKFSTIIRMENSPTIPTYFSFEDISTLCFKKYLELKAYGHHSSQLQRSIALADPKSRQTTFCLAIRDYCCAH